ncbi:MAG: 30S ribosomal protein S3 [Bacteroidota bacterium]
MGQKANPISLRLGYIRGWVSNWCADKKTFVKNLKEDSAIRQSLSAFFPKEIIAKSVIDRTLKNITLTIHTSRPGVLIGPGGKKLAEFSQKLKKITAENVQINISEVRIPDLDARLVGEAIATQIKSYMHYKTAVKKAISNTMSAGGKGIKVRIKGRLAGAEIARGENYKEGRTPLHTLRADIDHAIVKVNTTYGIIGIKVWIFKKNVYGKRDLSLNLEVRNKSMAKPIPHRKHNFARNK